MADKVALVTGASRGIGAATARALAQEGYAVACAARSTRERPHATAPGTLNDVVDQIRDAGGTAIPVTVDLENRAEVESMVDETVAELGRIDILVNNAATAAVGGLDIPLADHDRNLAIDFDAPFIAIRRAVPHMRSGGGGRILSVSSLAGLLTPPGYSLMSYGIAKLALERMTPDLADELKSDNIAVNLFRVDNGVANEAIVASMPDLDLETWVSPAVAAEGILWMLNQPISYTGQRESMVGLAYRENMMPAVVKAHPLPLPTTIF